MATIEKSKENRPYQDVVQQSGFTEFVLEMLQRLGLSKEQCALCTLPEVMIEFAKCFVTPGADPLINYGLYHIAGETFVNGCITMYFLEQIQKSIARKEREKGKIVPSTKLVDYFSKLKAKYISNKEFTSIATLYGFGEFIQYERDADGNEIRRLIDEEPYESNAFQAFMGCFEMMVDRYVEMYHSHYYINRFVHVMFSQLDINYQPSNVYDMVTLLKETNDILVGYDPFVKYEVRQHPHDPDLFGAFYIRSGKIDTVGSGPTITYKEIPVGMLPRSEENKIELSKRVYEWLAKEGKYIKQPPTVQELNIDFLV